jgi:hypothetical protein
LPSSWRRAPSRPGTMTRSAEALAADEVADLNAMLREAR